METLIFIWIGLTTYGTIIWAYSRIVALSRPTHKPIRYSQSHIHSLINPLLPPNKNVKKPIKTQSYNHENKHNIRVVIMDDVAYWIKDNAFYMAEIDKNGAVDKETTKVVDTHSMDGVQLDKMMFIIDKLREGLYDDRRGSGN